MSVLGAAEEFLDSQEDRFAAAVRVSIAGNVMDFGNGIALDSPEGFPEMFRDLVSEGIGSDDTPKLKELVEGSDTVLYAFDNCGESVLDGLLIREIRSMGKRVVGVVRGVPILNDVTLEDTERIGLECDRTVTTGAFAIGFPERISDSGLDEELGNAGVMIAKGMANYESLSEWDPGVPVAFLLRAKCIPVAESLGVPVGTNVVRILPTGNRQPMLPFSR